VEPHQTAAGFHTTSWTLVDGARADRAGLERLLRQYWSPIYAAIRRQGFGAHDASDLTQEFMTQVVIGRDLASKADPARGRFRSYLKQALRNFLIDRSRGRKRAEGDRPAHLATAEGDVGAPHPAALNSRPDPFDREWAAAVVEVTLQRLEASCNEDDLRAHWAAFRINVVGPTLRKTKPLSMDELAARIGAADATQASNMLQTVKRRFKRMLREVVAETVADPNDIEHELAILRTGLGR
jgi:DNA-directed RNA polymerase specialized sigma24 family protein